MAPAMFGVLPSSKLAFTVPASAELVIQPVESCR